MLGSVIFVLSRAGGEKALGYYLLFYLFPTPVSPFFNIFFSEFYLFNLLMSGSIFRDQSDLNLVKYHCHPHQIRPSLWHITLPLTDTRIYWASPCSQRWICSRHIAIEFFMSPAIIEFFISPAIILFGSTINLI